MSALNGCGSVGASVYSMPIKVDHRTSQGPPDSSSNMNWEGVFSEMPFELASDTDPLQLFQVASLSQIVKYGDKYLRVRKIEDWPNALNGLQIENSGNITKIGAAVDVSTPVLTAAAKQHVDLLIVHHGLFWPGLQPITGGLRRQLKIAFENDIALYSAHLPLDVHPEVGNNAQLAAALGIKSKTPFFEEKGQLIGLRTKASLSRDDLVRKLRKALGGPVKTFNFGPEKTSAIGIVTGSAGSESHRVAEA